MASSIGRLFQDRNVENVWVNRDASKSSKKGGGFQTSKKAPVGSVGKASGKLRASPRNRKALSDISNSAKLQKGSETSKKPVVKERLNVVAEEEPPVAECGFEEGFLHNHDECIKAQTREMDVEEFMRIISMDGDCPMQFGSPGGSTMMTTSFEPESPERNYKSLVEEGSWDLKLSPTWSLSPPPSPPKLDLSWMDEDDGCFNLKLIDSP
ncbi:hypothetical protein LINPERPRIM_LOCUS12357 [Linum perenne]